MTSIRLAWRYLSGRGLRSLLTTLAITFGVMLLFGMNGVIPAMLDAFDRSMMSSAGKIDLTVTSAFRQPIDATVLDTVARTEGVRAASAVVERPAPLKPDDSIPQADRVTQVGVVGIDPATAGEIRDFPLAEGRELGVADGDVVVLSSDLAGRLKLKLGDELVLPSATGSTRFGVVGLLTTPTAPGQETVYMPLRAAQRLFGLGDRITGVEASLAPDADRAAVEAAVSAALGEDYSVGGLSTNSSMLAALQMGQFIYTMFGVFALATAGFIILNSFRTMVAERRRDIGMLRAIGMKRRGIEAMFLVESLVQGIIGTALGIVAGMALANGMFALLGPMVESFTHMKLGGAIFEPSTWAMAIILGIGVTVLSALVPARAAGRVTPLEAMRPQLGEVQARRVGVRGWVGLALVAASLAAVATAQGTLVGLGAVGFLVGAALLAPAVVGPLADALASVVELAFPREGALARSNLQRNPGRSGITVTAVMLGLAAIVAMLAVIQSIFTGFMGYIEKSLSADYMLIPQSIVLSQGNVGAGPQLASEVRGTPGIGPVSTLRISQAKASGGDVQVIGIDPETYPMVASFEWNSPTTDAAYAELAQGRRLIANGLYATQHNLTAGDTLELDTPNGRHTYIVAGIGNDYLNAKLATVYISQDMLRRDFNSTTDMLVMADREPDADPAAVTARLQRLTDDYPAFKLYESQQWREEQQATFNQTYVMFYALIAILALPSLLALVNTLAMSVLARTREIGMLRAVGATRRQVRRMVMAESLLLSLIGSLFGVIAGIVLGFALVEAMGAVGWPMPWTFPWGGIVITLVVGIVFGVLAAVAPARSASKLDVVAALHQE